MLPVAYQIPAAAALLAIGLVACFAGYRLFRAVLTIYGFILGALFATSLVEAGNVPAMLVALVVGGVAGALVLFAGYFAGVVIVGAAFGALILHSLWLQVAHAEPHWLLVILFAVIGAVVAVYAQRIVIIVATAFVGAQTAVSGLVALLTRVPQRTGMGEWMNHLAPVPPGRRWPFFAWVILGVAGVVVQLQDRKK